MPINDSKIRKQTPIYSGLMAYFPDALEAVASVSWAGNEKHNPGEPLHWAREKSTDEYDACSRHLNDRAAGVEFDPELTKLAGRNIRTMACVAWRALAALQKEIEAERRAQELDRSNSEAPQQVWLHDEVIEPSARDDEAAIEEYFENHYE